MRMEPFLPTGGDLVHAVIRQLKETRLLVFWRTDNGYRLWQHHLVGAVCMQVHAGEESCLGRMCMDPAQSDEAVLVLDEEELLLVLRVAVVGAPVLLGDDDVGDCELVPHQLPTEDAACFHFPGRVCVCQLEKLVAELSGDDNVAKSINVCACRDGRRFG